MLVTSDPSLSGLNSGFCWIWLVWLFPCSYFKLLKFLGHFSPVASPEGSVRLLRMGWEDAHVTMPDICFTYQQTKCRWKNWVVSASAESWKTLRILQAKKGGAELVSQQNKIGKHRGRSSRSWKLTSPKATKQIAAREFGFVKDCVKLWELSLL